MPLHNPDQGDFERKAKELENYARQLASRYMFSTSEDFVYEQQVFIESLKRDIKTNCMSWRYGIAEIDRNIEYLKKQETMLLTQQIQMYAIIEKVEDQRNTNIRLARIGFVAAAAQVMGGIGICTESLGTACAGYGSPNIIQGLNNFYENGYYLLFQESTSGTVRDAYRYIVSKFGGSNNTADLIYGTVDIGLTTSSYTKLMMLSREKSWSLFRHIRSDYIRGWKTVTVPNMLVDGIGTSATGYQMYQIRQNQILEEAKEKTK
ncbi:DUF4225 domain-containing protein [Mangrovibacter plantisponsor]|uniref:Uncharacterized protein DUF4225 n=1 Tax=Mangrovibacter plantisponsor TaxID=451513 RepID=A0A317PWW6_9ENTR|nr:DUF4225 domain-containing protein [Mangrovibacter plantisponsor]PWW04967.1 uncharacterized protein DUF4225 [Mangrovibacter plantisponsor]